VSRWSNSVGVIALASVRDLRWRSRRFFLAALATGLVFGLTLMMSGVVNSFSVDNRTTVDDLGASLWLVRTGSPGAFTDQVPFAAGAVAAVRQVRGVEAADPVFIGQAITAGAITPGTGTSPGASSDRVVNMIGVVPGGIGSPRVVSGHPVSGRDSVVADERLGVGVGQEIALNGVALEVVGLVKGVTYFAGQPAVFVTIGTADQLSADGAPFATAVLVKGMPEQPIPGFMALTNAQVRADLGRPTAQVGGTIRLVALLLWLVAACIIGAIVYMSALERRGDFAVLKATGTPSSHLFIGLVLQAILMALVAAVIGLFVEIPMSSGSEIAVTLSPSNYLAVPIVAVIVGIVASVLPARRAARVDPAIAFGGGK
jgi:putative ABC transport system permease protein